MEFLLISMEIVKESFESAYAELLLKLLTEGNKVKSRAGEVIELIDVKTTITSPEKMCVGGRERDMNVFFLLMEAIWIFLGRSDVEPLAIFNSNMKNFSDDGKTFHAPYGFRLRSYGVPSDWNTFNKLSEEQGRQIFSPMCESFDQLTYAIKMLSEDSNDRRVVMSIWNSFLDLNFKCKDIPCNDMVMLKVRNGGLHLTVQNRSNDVHWGLPTNVFQFAFLGRIIAHCLNIQFKTQTHNSQSLHVYLDNPISLRMMNSKVNEMGVYGNKFKSHNIFKDIFIPESYSAVERLDEIHFHFNNIFQNVMYYYKEGVFKSDITEVVKGDLIFKLLILYLKYKSEPRKTDDVKINYISKIISIEEECCCISDLTVMAKSYFANKVIDNSKINDDWKY